MSLPETCTVTGEVHTADRFDDGWPYCSKEKGKTYAYENLGIPDNPRAQRGSGMGAKRIQLGQGDCGGHEPSRHTGCGVYADGPGHWPRADGCVVGGRRLYILQRASGNTHAEDRS